jgi:hypothetical protein
MSNDRGRAAPVLLILLAGVVVAASNVLLYLDAFQSFAIYNVPGSFVEALLAAIAQRPIPVFNFVAVPLAAAVLVAIAIVAGGPLSAPTEGTPAETEQEPAADVGGDAVLHLLASLQKEGRFIDFLHEDLAGYDDAQVGAAVRPIHEGCRQALRERVKIERVYDREEGAEIVVEKGFDPARIRLTGDVHGEPPFRGTLQHGGWRASKVDLPKTSAELDATVLAPAEVEVQRAPSPVR